MIGNENGEECEDVEEMKLVLKLVHDFDCRLVRKLTWAMPNSFVV